MIPIDGWMLSLDAVFHAMGRMLAMKKPQKWGFVELVWLRWF